jgi:transposase-like protein
MMEPGKCFPDKAACLAYLRNIRWPDGFECPHCRTKKAWPMASGRWLCVGCRKQLSVLSGTLFQDSKLPLTVWMRAMWQVTSQKNGVSAMGLQRVLGLGSYKTAWTLLHKLRRAMVRTGRERLRGLVEVDEAYWGGEEQDARGRGVCQKALLAVASEADGEGIGRIRLRHIPDVSRATLHRFIAENIEAGSTVQTDGLHAYRELKGYVHHRRIQRHQPKDAEHLLPRAHRVISLLKRWLLGTHQGSVGTAYLQDYLDEFTFRFNRRTSSSRGKLFLRIVEQAVQHPPATFDDIVA